MACATGPPQNAAHDSRPVTPTLFQRRIYGTVGLAVLVALYLLVGLTVHDPWRGDDARYSAPYWRCCAANPGCSRCWLGEPLADYPPLYFFDGVGLSRG